ncbi:RmlC-like cupin, partial [Tothia fuscella]
QSDRGNTKWTTLFSSQLAAVIASCPPKSKAPCTFSEAGIASFLAAHRHTQAEIYYILCGRGTVTIENVEYEVTPGTTVFIPGDAEHAVRNEGVEELRWLYVFPGKFEDVVYSFRHE